MNLTSVAADVRRLKLLGRKEIRASLRRLLPMALGTASLWDGVAKARPSPLRGRRGRLLLHYSWACIARGALFLSCIATTLALVCPMEAADARLLRGPYLQLPTPTTMTIRWRTDQPGLSRVNYGTELSALDASVNATTQPPTTASL
jgi:hypothetical protein